MSWMVVLLYWKEVMVAFPIWKLESPAQSSALILCGGEHVCVRKRIKRVT